MMTRVCSVFARLPRYHPSAPGTIRQRSEVKSARTATNRHREHRSDYQSSGLLIRRSGRARCVPDRLANHGVPRSVTAIGAASSPGPTLVVDATVAPSQAGAPPTPCTRATSWPGPVPGRTLIAGRDCPYSRLVGRMTLRSTSPALTTYEERATLVWTRILRNGLDAGRYHGRPPCSDRCPILGADWERRCSLRRPETR